MINRKTKRNEANSTSLRSSECGELDRNQRFHVVCFKAGDLLASASQNFIKDLRELLVCEFHFARGCRAKLFFRFG